MAKKKNRARTYLSRRYRDKSKFGDRRCETFDEVQRVAGLSPAAYLLTWRSMVVSRAGS